MQKVTRRHQCTTHLWLLENESCHSRVILFCSILSPSSCGAVYHFYTSVNWSIWWGHAVWFWGFYLFHPRESQPPRKHCSIFATCHWCLRCGKNRFIVAEEWECIMKDFWVLCFNWNRLKYGNKKRIVESSMWRTTEILLLNETYWFDQGVAESTSGNESNVWENLRDRTMWAGEDEGYDARCKEGVRSSRQQWHGRM